jgi:hypothetical protein
MQPDKLRTQPEPFARCCRISSAAIVLDSVVQRSFRRRSIILSSTTRQGIALVVAVLFVLPCFAQQIPHTEGKSLTDQPIVVPIPAATKPLVVIIAFSSKGGDDTQAWNKAFHMRYETDPRIDYAELADFQGVPSFIMRMILHGMRRSVQEPEKSHLAPFFSQEDAWKKLVSFGDSKVAYVLLADPSGRVVWQTTGPVSDQKVAALETAIVDLLRNTNRQPAN